ncbi:MAG: 2,3-diphosphoglycerate-dependent phosphoglycerate mutase [Gammaproteobacteria bacterium]|nr:2,3-diphosphoglycerate-dependent phosphoglycerate mutase [Gammaproteobacteria bacterium]
MNRDQYPHDPRSPGLLLIRHAQSEWNQQNRFTGWADPALTEQGIEEARRAAGLLLEMGYRFDRAWSSELRRAVHTLELLLDGIGQPGLARQHDWRLNERHYGALQGADKTAMTHQAGEQQVWRWRRGYRDRPPAMSQAQWQAQYPDWAGRTPGAALPHCETLAETRERVSGFYRERILPSLARGERVLISSHGNTLRALLMELMNMSVAEVEGFEIPTATPIELEFVDNHGNGPMIEGWRYLGSTTAREVA